MAFQFMAFHHSFSTLVVLPLFFSTWPFNLWPFTIHSQHWWPFDFSFSTWPFYFVALTIHLQHWWPFTFLLNMAFHFVAFDHSFPTLVAFQFFVNMAVHFVAVTSHPQHWWPLHFFFPQHGLSFVAFDHSFSTLVAMIFFGDCKKYCDMLIGFFRFFNLKNTQKPSYCHFLWPY
jgi:hypothetical protein